MKPTNSIYIGGPPLDPPDEESEEPIELDEPEGDYGYEEEWDDDGPN